MFACSLPVLTQLVGQLEAKRYNCVGTSLLPPAEHALADWEGTVAQRSQQKLEKLAEDIAKLEASYLNVRSLKGHHESTVPQLLVQATENQQGLRYQLAGGDAAMAPDLSFLAVETVRVHLVSLPHRI